MSSITAHSSFHLGQGCLGAQAAFGAVALAEFPAVGESPCSRGRAQHGRNVVKRHQSSLLIKDRDFENAVDVPEPLPDVVGNGLVALHHHDGVAALVAAVELHGGDVDLPLGEGGGDRRDVAGGVLIVDDEGVVLPGEVGGDAVDGADPGCARPPRSPPQCPGCAVRPRSAGAGRCWEWAPREVGGWRKKFSPRSAARAKLSGMRLSSGCIPRKPGDEGPVSAVAPAGEGEAARQTDLRPDRRTAQQPLRHPADAHGAGGVAAGGPDHHRPRISNKRMGEPPSAGLVKNDATIKVRRGGEKSNFSLRTGPPIKRRRRAKQRQELDLASPPRLREQVPRICITRIGVDFGDSDL